jgi:polyphosphate kinase 2 (PPK2 family)
LSLAGTVDTVARVTSWTGDASGSSPDYLAALAALRDQLAELQLPQIAHGRRAIIIFEGPEGAGKKHALKQLAAAFDPCHVAIHPVRHDRRESAEGHWLAPFWRNLPGAGSTAIFFRSWYRRVLDDRLGGRIVDKALARAFDEINEFEAQQRDYGTLLVKLFFEVSPEVQERRLAERAANPWSGVVRREEPIRVATDTFAQALEDLYRNTDTRWSPWRKIDGNDERGAALSALTTIADIWAETMPAEPPHIVESPGRAA